MGRRSGGETALGIVAAFHIEATWEQARLARHVGVEVRTLRRALDDLARFGMPVESEVENHSRVYWSVPDAWRRTLDTNEISACARLLMRLPATRERDALLARFLHAPPRPVLNDAVDERVTEVLEDALRARVAVRMDYRSTTNASAVERTVSVQRLFYGEHRRFVAVCHRSNTLKWFRVDRASAASLDRDAPFFSRTEEDVASFVADGVAGYHGDEPATVVRFFVKNPEARWAIDDLSHEHMTLQRTDDGVVVTLRTTAVVALARRLVGLGDAVRIETPDLRRRVVALARAALRAEDAVRPLARAGRRDSAVGGGNRGVTR